MHYSIIVSALTAVMAAGVAHAAAVMPDLAAVPTGWTTDRYEPHSFSNIGTFQGRDNVLGIEINTAEGFGSRGGGFDSTFYNTQGRQHAIAGGAGAVLAADLFLPTAWGNAANGSRRTDIWGVINGGADYPIIGFTNFGGAARYRVWDDDTSGGWVDLAAAVQYDVWNTLSIELTASSYIYSINGAVVYTDNTIPGGSAFTAVIMQAYNFNGTDPALAGAVAGDPAGNYTAAWSNVPEPATLAVLGLGLIGLVAARRRA